MAHLNRDWHARHPMPPNANLEQRVTWHLAHAQHCACRPVPDSVRRALKARGLSIPEMERVGED
ncbi:hypothetical protein [Niveibacterium sp. SC-1]|uniref:hypothetical protein n=1 Tax=Niveibacterium sp. SC-1 TaxID=3135646 RepID=UPI00311F912A